MTSQHTLTPQPSTTPQHTLTPQPLTTSQHTLTPQPLMTPQPSTTSLTPQSTTTIPQLNMINPQPTMTPQPSTAPQPVMTPQPLMNPQLTSTSQSTMMPSTPRLTMTPQVTMPPGPQEHYGTAPRIIMPSHTTPPGNMDPQTSTTPNIVTPQVINSSNITPPRATPPMPHPQFLTTPPHSASMQVPRATPSVRDQRPVVIEDLASGPVNTSRPRPPLSSVGEDESHPLLPLWSHVTMPHPQVPPTPSSNTTIQNQLITSPAHSTSSLPIPVPAVRPIPVPTVPSRPQQNMVSSHHHATPGQQNLKMELPRPATSEQGGCGEVFHPATGNMDPTSSGQGQLPRPATSGLCESVELFHPATGNMDSTSSGQGGATQLPHPATSGQGGSIEMFHPATGNMDLPHPTSSGQRQLPTSSGQGGSFEMLHPTSSGQGQLPCPATTSGQGGSAEMFRPATGNMNLPHPTSSGQRQLPRPATSGQMLLQLPCPDMRSVAVTGHCKIRSVTPAASGHRAGVVSCNSAAVSYKSGVTPAFASGLVTSPLSCRTPTNRTSSGTSSNLHPSSLTNQNANLPQSPWQLTPAQTKPSGSTPAKLPITRLHPPHHAHPKVMTPPASGPPSLRPIASKPHPSTLQSHPPSTDEGGVFKFPMPGGVAPSSGYQITRREGGVVSSTPASVSMTPPLPLPSPSRAPPPSSPFSPRLPLLASRARTATPPPQTTPSLSGQTKVTTPPPGTTPLRLIAPPLGTRMGGASREFATPTTRHTPLLDHTSLGINNMPPSEGLSVGVANTQPDPLQRAQKRGVVSGEDTPTLKRRALLACPVPTTTTPGTQGSKMPAQGTQGVKIPMPGTQGVKTPTKKKTTGQQKGKGKAPQGGRGGGRERKIVKKMPITPSPSSSHTPQALLGSGGTTPPAQLTKVGVSPKLQPLLQSPATPINSTSPGHTPHASAQASRVSSKCEPRPLLPVEVQDMNLFKMSIGAAVSDQQLTRLPATPTSSLPVPHRGGRGVAAQPAPARMPPAVIPHTGVGVARCPPVKSHTSVSLASQLSTPLASLIRWPLGPHPSQDGRGSQAACNSRQQISDPATATLPVTPTQFQSPHPLQKPSPAVVVAPPLPQNVDACGSSASHVTRVFCMKQEGGPGGSHFEKTAFGSEDPLPYDKRSGVSGVASVSGISGITGVNESDEKKLMQALVSPQLQNQHMTPPTRPRSGIGRPSSANQTLSTPDGLTPPTRSFSCPVTPITHSNPSPASYLSPTNVNSSMRQSDTTDTTESFPVINDLPRTVSEQLQKILDSAQEFIRIEQLRQTSEAGATSLPESQLSELLTMLQQEAGPGNSLPVSQHQHHHQAQGTYSGLGPGSSLPVSLHQQQGHTPHSSHLQQQQGEFRTQQVATPTSAAVGSYEQLWAGLDPGVQHQQFGGPSPLSSPSSLSSTPDNPPTFRLPSGRPASLSPCNSTPFSGTATYSRPSSSLDQVITDATPHSPQDHVTSESQWGGVEPGPRARQLSPSRKMAIVTPYRKDTMQNQIRLAQSYGHVLSQQQPEVGGERREGLERHEERYRPASASSLSPSLTSSNSSSSLREALASLSRHTHTPSSPPPVAMATRLAPLQSLVTTPSQSPTVATTPTLRPPLNLPGCVLPRPPLLPAARTQHQQSPDYRQAPPTVSTPLPVSYQLPPVSKAGPLRALTPTRMTPPPARITTPTTRMTPPPQYHHHIHTVMRPRPLRAGPPNMPGNHSPATQAGATLSLNRAHAMPGMLGSASREERGVVQSLSGLGQVSVEGGGAGGVVGGRVTGDVQLLSSGASGGGRVGVTDGAGFGRPRPAEPYRPQVVGGVRRDAAAGGSYL